jgi:hypothetical protein
MKKFVLVVLILSAVLPIAAQQRKTKGTRSSTLAQARADTSVPETIMIVPAGENAPESIIRVVSTTKIAVGKHRVTVVGGPCRSQSRTRFDYIIDTKETLAKGDLFFVVPVGDPFSGWALRRANSREAAQYANCQWRDNEPEESIPDYRTYIGKDLNELLRGVPDVNRRLRKLLGRNYQLFMNNTSDSFLIEKAQ